MTLTESVRTGWRDIRTATHLRGALLNAARRLDEIGWPDLAGKWRDRVAHMPRKLGKEAINCVLLAASMELDDLGIED